MSGPTNGALSERWLQRRQRLHRAFVDICKPVDASQLTFEGVDRGGMTELEVREHGGHPRELRRRDRLAVPPVDGLQLHQHAIPRAGERGQALGHAPQGREQRRVVELHLLRHLPVVDGETLVGLVSETDILRCVAGEA